MLLGDDVLDLRTPPAGSLGGRLREAAAARSADDALKRVLYHVVSTYDYWRDVPEMMPNELLDDAVRVGRQCLKDNDWWPDADELEGQP